MLVLSLERLELVLQLLLVTDGCRKAAVNAYK